MFSWVFFFWGGGGGIDFTPTPAACPAWLAETTTTPLCPDPIVRQPRSRAWGAGVRQPRHHWGPSRLRTSSSSSSSRAGDEGWGEPTASVTTTVCCTDTLAATPCRPRYHDSLSSVLDFEEWGGGVGVGYIWNMNYTSLSCQHSSKHWTTTQPNKDKSIFSFFVFNRLTVF